MLRTNAVFGYRTSKLALCQTDAHRTELTNSSIVFFHPPVYLNIAVADDSYWNKEAKEHEHTHVGEVLGRMARPVGGTAHSRLTGDELVPTNEGRHIRTRGVDPGTPYQQRVASRGTPPRWKNLSHAAIHDNRHEGIGGKRRHAGGAI